LLLDQSILAGVGNIYADEALFRARIHPARPAGSLSSGEITALIGAVAQVLAEGVAHGGSSLGDSGLTNYVRPGGEQGGYQGDHKVFHRTGKPCYLCGTPVERIVLAQRSTHFCPNCQR
jgi:formamidopyrimidine-DNA glycosylase